MKISQKLRHCTLLGAAALLAVSTVACGTKPPQGQSDQPIQEQTSNGHMGMGHDAMQMDLGPKDESFDLRFIDAMMLHHQGAIAMAQEAQTKSTRSEVKQLAANIITAQEQEIAQMKAWRQAWYPNAGAQPMMHSAEMGHMMPMSAEMKTAMTMSMDLGEADDQFDQRFLQAMIPHHEGALEMAKEAQAKSDRPEIKQLAEAILSSQQQEIDQMQQWEQAWYGKP